MSRQPLTPLRVLVTRPREQAAEFCDFLAGTGLEPLCLPVISPRPVEDTAPLDSAVARLAMYDWLVFASANGARFFFDRLRQLGGALPPPERLRIVAGPATATVLAGYGVAPALVPSPFSAERALQAMDAAGLAPGARVLLPRAEQGLDLLAAGLRARGAHVDEVILYRTETDHAGSDELARHLVAGAVHAITFFSPSAVQGVAAALAATGLAPADQAQVVARMIVACIGPTTAAAVQERGWRVDVIAPTTTARALGEALVAYLRAHPVGSDPFHPGVSGAPAEAPPAPAAVGLGQDYRGSGS
jgi:uroporphyrinogen-III synthase